MRDYIESACHTTVYTVLILCAAAVEYGRAQDQESLPPVEAESAARPQYCPPIEDRPLTALTVDISPLGAEGQLVTQHDVPQGCLPASTAEPLPFYVTYGPECWNCHDLLQLARFCHPRVYFEDVLVERYGVVPVFPCVHSVGKFTWDLALLPAHLMVNKRHPCVRTPTPHCWSGCSVCGF